MVGNTPGPGILPKTALFGSKVVYYPFTVPQKLNDSATLVGQVNHGLVKNITGSVGQAIVDLKPRGPAKWLLPLLGKTMEAVDHSEKIAARNKAVFWDPFSQGSESIGRAIAGPGAYWFLRKSGVEAPTAGVIQGTLQKGLFDFSVGEDTGIGGAPAPAQAPAPQPVPEDTGASQASEGAGEVVAEQQQPAA